MAKKTDAKVKKAAGTTTKTPAKKAAAKVTAAPKKAPALAKKAAVPKKAATVKSAPPKKAATVKASAVPQKTIEAKKAPMAKKAAAAPVKKAPVQKPAVKKSATPVKKATPAPKAAVKKSVPVVSAKSNVVKVAAKPAKPAAPKTGAKAQEKNPPVITKKVKKEAQPLKEVKVPKITTTAKKSYNPAYIPMDERATDINQEPLVRYSEEELNEFKALIMKKLADARREVSYLQGIITRRDDMGGDIESRYMTMEDGTISMEREQQSQMASRQISYIDNLEKALIRIENKTYGICRITGKLIDKARLRAVPHATLSIEAKLNRRNYNEQ